LRFEEKKRLVLSSCEMALRKFSPMPNPASIFTIGYNQRSLDDFLAPGAGASPLAISPLLAFHIAYG